MTTSTAEMVHASAGTAPLRPHDEPDTHRRLERIALLLPFPALAMSVLLAGFLTASGYGTWQRFQLGLVTAAAAGLWATLIAVGRQEHRQPLLVFRFGVHTLLAGVLVWCNPMYGFYAWTGYLYAGQLPRRWARSGIVATALVLAASQLGGYPSLTVVSIGGFVLVALFNAAVALAFTELSRRVADQNRERGRMIGDLAESNRRLEAAMAENAGLHAQLVAQAREAGVQDERQRMAGEIHDTLAQGLAGIVTQLEAAKQTAQWAGAMPERARHHFEQAQRLAREGLSEARRSVQALRPEQLEESSLVEAASALARDWSAATGVRADVQTSGTPYSVGPDIEAVLFRVAQEALANVAKHANASTVWITLSYLDDTVLLDVRDDGRGFDVERPPDRHGAGGFGLTGMSHRLARVHGTLEVESAPGDGTALSAAVPVSAVRVGAVPVDGGPVDGGPVAGVPVPVGTVPEP